jgi:phenylacetate-coenzyme A ligase PaaK-like adenylate-forming protein
MQAAGLEPGDIKGIEDLDKLPYTTYQDLRDTYPFGLAAAPRSELVRVHASSGTTGKPKIAVYTRRDIDIWAECVARCLSMAGITKDDIIKAKKELTIADCSKYVSESDCLQLVGSSEEYWFLVGAVWALDRMRNYNK